MLDKWVINDLPIDYSKYSPLGDFLKPSSMTFHIFLKLTKSYYMRTQQTYSYGRKIITKNGRLMHRIRRKR